MHDHDDNRTITETVRLLLRFWWLIALGAIASGAVAVFATSATATSGRTATSTLGLSDEVDWPFYAQTRDAYVSLGEVRTDDLGADVTSFEVRANDSDETRLIVVVTAADESAARDGVEVLVESLLEASVTGPAEQLTEDRDLLAADLDTLRLRIEEVRAAMTESASAEAAAQLRVDERLDSYVVDFAALRAFQQTRSDLGTELNALVRNEAEISVDLLEIDRALAGSQGELEVIAPVTIDPISSRSPTTIGVVGAAVGAVLAMMAITTLLSGREPVSTGTLEARFGGVPILSPDGDRPFPFQSHQWNQMIDASGDVALLRSRTMTSTTPDWIKPPQIEGVIGTASATEAIALADSVILLVGPRDRLADVDQAVRSIEAMGPPLTAIAVADS